MSLKQIARSAGTSVSTVSRVLNNPNHHCHNEGLEEHIWQLASKYQYTPNTFARNLRKRIVDTTVAYTVDIFLTRFDSMDQDAFFRELFQCIKEELISTNCILGDMLTAADIATLGQSSKAGVHIPYKSSGNAYVSYIPQKENTGLIILGKCPANLIPILKKRYRCIAGIDRNPTEYEYDEVVCNGATAASKAIEYLISLGHKSIAYIGDCSYESRYIGYYSTLLNHQIPLNHMNVFPTDQTMEGGIQAMQAILQSANRPSAIFCANDVTALGVFKALKSSRKKGYTPSIISIDNIVESEKTEPMLTTIDIPKKEMAHMAVALLLDRKKGTHKETVRVELPCCLVERDSCSYYMN